MFDAFDDWFRGGDYEGCFFVNTLLESHREPIAAASIAKLQNVRAFLETLARAAGGPIRRCSPATGSSSCLARSSPPCAASPMPLPGRGSSAVPASTSRI